MVEQTQQIAFSAPLARSSSRVGVHPLQSMPPPSSFGSFSQSMTCTSRGIDTQCLMDDMVADEDVEMLGEYHSMRDIRLELRFAICYARHGDASHSNWG